VPAAQINKSATVVNNNNNNIILIYLTANGLSLGGSGYYACTKM
jgi:hypothetical protein